MSSDTDSDEEFEIPDFPDGAAPRAPPDAFITLPNRATKHVYNVDRDRSEQIRSACGSHTFDVDDTLVDKLEVWDARRLLLSHLEGDSTEGQACKNCRRTANLDDYINPDTLHRYLEGEFDGSDEEPDDDETPVTVVEPEDQFIPIDLSVDAEIRVPATERAYQVLEAVGKAAASQTALDRRDTTHVDPELVEGEEVSSDDDD